MLFACFVTAIAGAQEIRDDSSFVDSAIAYAKALQKKETGENFGLYNGIVNDVRLLAPKGHPYFFYDQLKEGTILYDGFQYDHVPLLYDLVSNVVLTESYDRLHNVQLIDSKLSRFTIGDHSFVRLQADSMHGASMPAGFYEVLHNGELLALARHEKTLMQKAKGEALESFFKSYDQYFILSGNHYYSVSNNGSLLSVFGKNKSDVRAYLHKNNLNFKTNPERTIVKACLYYEQLTR